MLVTEFVQSALEFSDTNEYSLSYSPSVSAGVHDRLHGVLQDGTPSGMAKTPWVDHTAPLDNLISEINDFLGPGPPCFSKPKLPHYVQDIPSWFAEDISYLMSKDAFTTPDQTLCRELLRSFIEWVYPFIPVLDLSRLLNAFCGNGKSEKISLLLFHAIMFSAAAFVDVKHLYNAGYQTRRKAREDLFSKTRVLYDFDYENDRVTTIQSLLLMTYWHETPQNPKDSQHWLDVCWSLGSSIGLHCDPSTAQISCDHRRIWKRLWWCLYTRNRLIALNLRRPISFKKNSGRNMPFLDLEDFDIHRYSDKAIKIFDGCEFLRDLRLQERSAVSFIEKAKLSVLISEVAILRDFRKDGCPSPGTPGNDEDEFSGAWMEQYGKTLETLHLWHARAPADMERTNQQNHILYVQHAWIRLVFLTTLGTLYREIACITMPYHEKPAYPDRQVLQEMSSIMQDLHNLGVVYLLPTTAVALLVPVLVMHFSDLRSSSDGLQLPGFQNFYRCMRVLSSLGDTYSFAVIVRQFFEDALGNIGGASPPVVPTMIQDLLTSKEHESLIKAQAARSSGDPATWKGLPSIL
ncbi:hypothetical protein PENSOL_c097G00150 [Penicillium solitum]|uniref:Xylanolytic transcriptional activator regulatory domain-containing protein n=1 Tax=Penicillium solitum TaxID=60172 RepID=A0A1V6Q8M2_9EURO|nr:uncharacterized protein PENSOL_c097G00150 [Penicillium solitum]OQD85581.1 hypothetical protein PENSOL_c097G00150 [Penicillium solitum]